MCKFSIIVPVYNMAADSKLEYCINSLLNQTINDYELIAVDDKSTDNSLEILRDFERRFPEKMRVIESEENGRQGAARNKGIAAAKGEYLGFMDADDWVFPDTYECVLRKAEETGADVVGFDMCIVNEHTMIPTERIPCNLMEQTGVIDHERRALLILKYGPFSTKIYRKEFFQNPPFRFPEKVAYEDNAVQLELAMRVKHYEHIPEVKCFYYHHPDSTTHTITKKSMDDRMNAMRMLLQTAKDREVLDEYHKEIEFLYAKTFYANTLFSYMQSDMKKSIRFLRELKAEIRRDFPDYIQNSYFLDTLDGEELKWIQLHRKSTLLFYWYYQLKKFYRKKRYGKW